MIARLLQGTADAALTYLVALLQRSWYNLIYIQHTVEVVAFVLEDDGGEALDAFGGVAQGRADARGAAGRGVAGRISGRGDEGVLYVYIPVAQHVTAEAGNGEAAFGAGGKFAAPVNDPHVRIHLEGLSGFVEALHGHDSPQNPHLGPRDSDAILGRMLDGCQQEFR